VERQVMLRIIDQRWREHLEEMDYLQEGINLRAMGQKDPLVEWQREGFEMFAAMMKGVAQDFVKYVMHVQVVRDTPTAGLVADVRELSGESRGFSPETSAGPDATLPAPPEAPRTVVKQPGDWSNTPRNAPCPCGSGRKYKMCHGRG
jgi:preprotein translocase subunit SecA